MATVYNVIYRGNFCSPDGTDNIIEFKRRMLDTDPVPVVTPIQFAGHDESPVIIEFQDKGEYKLEPINGLSCTVRITAIDSFELRSLYTADEREWQVSVNGLFSFVGWLIPDSCTEPYESKPYNVSVEATDSLGTLEDVPFQQVNGVKYKGFLSDIEILRICLNKTGLSLPFSIGINTFEATMNTLLCPLQQTYRDTARYVDKDGNPFSCQEVLRSILEHWSSRLHQWNGKWQMINLLEKSKGDVKAWQFTTEGTSDSWIMLGNSITAGGIERELQPAEAQVLTAKAFKSSTAYYQYGYPTNELINGDFDIAIPPAIPDFWTSVNGATGYSETRIDQATGLPTGDHYLIITSNGDGSGYYFNTSSVSVRANQKVTVSFDLRSDDAFLPVGNPRYLGVVIQDNLGKYYTAENGWQTGFSFYVIAYKSGDFQFTDLRVNFEVSQQPNDYLLNFGVQAIALAGPTQYQTKINNVNVKPETVSSQTAPPLGLFNRQTLTAPQTYKKDPILLLHGDEFNDQRTSRISINTSLTVTPPTTWNRSGITETKSLLHIVANSELRAHQQPYLVFSATFKGYGYIDVNTLLTVDLLESNEFIFLSGSFDLKKGEHTLRFAETLTDEPLYTEELAIEDYGSEKGKQGMSVGQPDTVPTSPGGSYTDLAGLAKLSDIPVKASATETQSGTNDDKFITPFKLLGWWTNIKTLSATISGLWNFTTRPTFNGNGLITNADLQTFSDSLSTTTTVSTPFTNSTLNSTWPTAPVRFEVYAPNIYGGVLYRKVAASQWIYFNVTIL